MKNWIQRHNLKTLAPAKDEDQRKCNCMISKIVYKATVKPDKGDCKVYYGLTENTFKKRWDSHQTSFRHQNYRNATELSKFAWYQKENGINYEMKWDIHTRTYAFRNGSKNCDLCLSEKTAIALADPRTTLNNRTEMLSKCRHKWKHKLGSILTKPRNPRKKEGGS